MTGLSGTYGLYADAVRLAASRAGILPQQMQAITWEAKKSTLGETSKEGDAAIEKIWHEYHAGTGSLRETQEKIWSLVTKDLAEKAHGRATKAAKHKTTKARTEAQPRMI